jgi:hypothetical protein
VWQPLHLLGGACRALRLPKLSIHDSVGSDKSSSFQQCSVCSQRKFRWAAVKFFFLSSHALEIRTSHSKKQLCPSICNFINFSPHSFDYYLFCFWCLFFSFFFSKFYPCAFYFFIFLYSNWFSYFWLLFLCVLYFS